MKNIVCLFLMASGVAFSQSNSNSKKVTPFMPEFFKEYPNVRDISISTNQEEVYFTVLGFKKEFSFIAVSKFENGEWSKPNVASFSGQNKDLEPFLSPNNLQLFFASNRPLNNEEKTDFDIWVVTRESLASEWGIPKNLGATINTLKDEFYPAVASSGNLYFTATIDSDTKGKEDIYISEFRNGKYENPKSLSNAINSETYEFNAYVSPDESVIIFSSYNRSDGFGGGDLYMSKRDENGSWIPAKNLGKKVNSNRIDYCPFIDLNSNILYYTSEKSIQKSKFDTAMRIDEFLAYFNTSPNGMSRIFNIELDQFHID